MKTTKLKTSVLAIAGIMMGLAPQWGRAAEPQAADTAARLMSAHPFRYEYLAEPYPGRKGKLFSEGTGTRGGGSGVLTHHQDPESLGVELLDLYRSHHPQTEGTFFAPEERLTAISRGNEPERAAEIILKRVGEKIRKYFPPVADRLEDIQKSMPFSHWVSSVVHLPLQRDYHGQLALDGSAESHVQIAYRRANQIIYDQQYLHAMDGLNRAALILHEYIYAILGAKDSFSVQQLVSFFLSADTDEKQYAETAQKLFTKLILLDGIYDRELKLPSGVRRTDSSVYRKSDLCGVIRSLKVAPDGLIVQMGLDPAHPHFSRDDVVRHNQDVVEILTHSPHFSDSRELKLKKKEMKTFLLAFFFMKDFLQKKYPIYLYPAQSVPMDVICVNHSGKVFSLEGALEWNKERNERDLQSAKNEADYYRVYGEYLIDSNPLLLDLVELKLLNDKIHSSREGSTFDILTAIQGASELERVHLEFVR